MLSVGLFEPAWHRALIPPMTTIAREATSEVTVFTTQNNRDHAVAALDPDVVDGCEWIVEREGEATRSFFDRVGKLSSKLDVLWTITPFGHPETRQALLSFRPRCPSVTFLHSTSHFLTPSHPHLARGIANVTELAGHRFPSPIRNRIWKHLGEYLSPNLIEAYDTVLSIYPPVIEYINQHVKPDASVNWFLPEYYQPHSTTDHDGLRITVPGRVEHSRRNYDTLFNVLENTDGIKELVNICVLGRAVGSFGEGVMRRCVEYKDQGYDITYYPDTDWVSAEEFAYRLARTDLIFSPDNISEGRENERRKSIRGQTKGSGAVGDSIRIGRPLVMPQEFAVAPEFNGLITTYSSNSDAANLLQSWLSSPETRRELQQQATGIAQQFDLAAQADRFEYLCRRTINTSHQNY